MPTLTVGAKAYEVDESGFLLDFRQWDEGFAREVAKDQQIEGDLTSDHWRVIRYIHAVFREEGRCPLVFQTCRSNKLRLKDLATLFPTGYLRGACKLAGITYREGYHGYGCAPPLARRYGQAEAADAAEQARPMPLVNKTYSTDVRGFLVDPASWDEQYATMRASDMKMPALTERHWTLLWYVRDYYEAHREVPTVYQACEANHLEVDELAELFPDGYQRGLVKLAGLRVL
jgi:tRNA 2-thiouridine synthesizing protein E